jgi:hypothetical protein
MRTDQYPNEEYMLPRWNRGRGPGAPPRRSEEPMKVEVD